MLHSFLANEFLLFFLIFLSITSVFSQSIDVSTVNDEETVVEGKIKLCSPQTYRQISDAHFCMFRFTEHILCKYCGSDVTISNFFLNKLSPLALFASNQSIYNQQKVLIQTLQNPLGIQFKVAIVRKANCAALDIKVSRSLLAASRSTFCSRISILKLWLFLVSSGAIISLGFPDTSGAFVYVQIPSVHVIWAGCLNRLIIQN